MSVLLEVRGVGRQLSEDWLLREVSFQLDAGQLLVVMGPSGAGKSTLLRLLNRLDEASQGAILLAGRDIRQLEPQDLRRRVGMVMQAPHLFPGDVASNLRYGPQQRGHHLSDPEVEELLATMGLSGFADRSVQHLSGGEAARVSLARTLANQPELLLLDEPTAALDEAISREIEALIATLLRSQGHTAIWITHDQAQARRVADRILWLEAGRAKAFGEPGAILEACT